ncbi:MAG: hypothetical protein O2890_13585 [Cyanobacteria bacterium]|nr:hypothetical protein [Cyanobacteriota bacterium]MDA0867412.1 hypothetical protein [Cyanobacteriota bacterium]
MSLLPALTFCVPLWSVGIAPENDGLARNTGLSMDYLATLDRDALDRWFLAL